MGAMTLLVDRQGAKLGLSSNREAVCLSYADGQEFRVGLNALKRILVHGDVSLPASLLRHCDAAGVSIVLVPGRGRGNSLQLLPNTRHNFGLRLAQYRAWFDGPARLELARRFVSRKIRHQAESLRRHNLPCDFAGAEHHALNAPDTASLMGIEGSASREYLAHWRTLWDAQWEFQDRNRRPPRDPINALLSLSYTLAGHELEHLAHGYGLESALGFLHAPSRGRPSLALDLLEPVRPHVDAWLWREAQHNGMFKPEYFYQDEQLGCRLDKTGRGLFYSLWHDSGERALRQPMRDSLAMLLRTLRNYRALEDGEDA